MVSSITGKMPEVIETDSAQKALDKLSSAVAGLSKEVAKIKERRHLTEDECIARSFMWVAGAFTLIFALLWAFMFGRDMVFDYTCMSHGHVVTIKLLQPDSKNGSSITGKVCQ